MLYLHLLRLWLVGGGGGGGGGGGDQGLVIRLT